MSGDKSEMLSCPSFSQISGASFTTNNCKECGSTFIWKRAMLTLVGRQLILLVTYQSPQLQGQVLFCIRFLYSKYAWIHCRHIIRSPSSIAFVWIKVNRRERQRHLHWTSMCGVYTGGWLRSLSKVLTDISQSTASTNICERCASENGIGLLLCQSHGHYHGHSHGNGHGPMCFRWWNQPIITLEWTLAQQVSEPDWSPAKERW